MQIKIIIDGFEDYAHIEFKEAKSITMYNWHTYRLINVPGDFILDDGGNVYEVLARQFHRDIITIWLKYN
jgi:hypothetical protein